PSHNISCLLTACGGDSVDGYRLRLPVSRFQLNSPVTGNWKLETGNWQRETGNWKLATENSNRGACMRSASGLSLIILFAALSIAATDNKFLSTFKSPDAGNTTFVGKKVATLVIADDDGLRVSGEEALARELEARGI